MSLRSRNVDQWSMERIAKKKTPQRQFIEVKALMMAGQSDFGRIPEAGRTDVEDAIAAADSAFRKIKALTI